MPERERYRFGEFLLDVGERRLLEGVQPVPLPPKTFDLLVVLVRQAGKLVTKRGLLDAVWAGSFVEEGILSVHVSTIRKALGDSGRERRYIETVPRSGYRFAPDVVVDAGSEARAPWVLAVLPAHPVTAHPVHDDEKDRDAAIGLAVADLVIDRLGRARGMLVRPTRSVKRHTDPDQDPAVIGRLLRADAVLSLRFERLEARIRLTGELLASSDGTRLWRSEFEGPDSSLTALADRVAASVTAHLGTDIAESRDSEGTLPAAVDPNVYEHVGRGRSHLLSGSMFELNRAVEEFESAIELDPTYAPAHAGLALACCGQAAMRMRPPAEAYGRARKAALKALAMDDTSADAQVALGVVLFQSEWDWEGAARSLERALSLNPNHTEAYLQLGSLLQAQGKLEEGHAMNLKALQRDPFSPLVHLQISMSCWNLRRFDDAVVWAEKALEVDPEHPHAREYLAAAYWKTGDFDRQMEVSLKHAELHGAPPEALEPLKQAYRANGREGVVRFTLESAAQSGSFPAFQLAVLYGELGELDTAFQHLERAIDNHESALVHLSVAPQWDSLRSDPRFDECVARMRLSG